ncbi:class A beta-lactamase, subclass A2 [Dyadobacter sp. CY261]|uniref:class A beta-lactamase, subclass A2 n=1 Tax=Dyadobacter sp. CY261 TaxID=2907203 RepID=UPI001EFF48FA|nr:class A beta-lactamase, subclass A2 [Dyadobacter sp. CY261]MCF0070461.1 class A beta-lactamase, subclass A2 [Dyadobacter sp. CY261]
MSRFIPLVVALLFIQNIAFAQQTKLKSEIETISKLAQGIVGVGIMDLKTKEALLINQDHKFPMQSTFKFPLAIAVLDLIDKGKYKLDQKIHVTQAEVNKKTHSPMLGKYPDQDFDITIAELLSYSVSESDNNACDILFELAGGTKKVNDYIHSLGVKDIAIVATEKQMSTGWDVQYTNYARPSAYLQLLQIAYERKKLSETSHDFLWKILVEGPTGLKRIKGQLPKGTEVAHKTGTSNTNEKGITAATNDVGIMKLPNGKAIAVVVFVSDAAADSDARELVIARIAKAAWNYYGGN